MQRKRLEWKLKRRTLQMGDRTLIMAILNVTPDSFSDGGDYTDPDRAFARAIELEEQGADIIDIGAESTKPGSQPVSEAEELRRLIPVLKRLRDQLSIPVSVDTYKSAVAERALEHGAEIINDPSGLTFDPQLAKVVTNYDAGLVINHMRGTPDTWAKLPPLPDPAGAVARELEACVSRARRVGVDRERIVVDPGLGFGKRKEQNSEVLGRLAQVVALGLPVLVGPSRKSFLAGKTDEETKAATAAAVAISILGGAHIVRVHDVREMLAAAAVTDEVIAGMLDPDAVIPAAPSRPVAPPPPSRRRPQGPPPPPPRAPGPDSGSGPGPRPRAPRGPMEPPPARPPRPPYGRRKDDR